ncbi:MAG: Holliday junction resolvase RuvX [Bifidobacteriaceae bacterium]|jgi:putative Holliday junction resolvase|nr:Holliday junction resolvase RuvX [Bifidobacteriaceae bacterium]
MRRGRRLAIDVGDARVGVAHSDPDGILATPVATIARAGMTDHALAGQIVQIADDDGAIEIIVGHPVHLSGAAGAAAGKAQAFAQVLAGRWHGGVRLVDERLTTVEAKGHLRGAGRDERSGRAVIDQVAAVLILQSALDRERSTGELPGEPVTLQSPGARDKEGDA